MLESNKSYRIRTKVNEKNSGGFISIDTNLLQDYNTLDILSIKIKSEDMYRLHNSNYGVIVGRVLANNGFGVPNAKLSIFIEADGNDDEKLRELYPFINSGDKDNNNVRYNLLPDNKVEDCHQIVGTFPNKRYMLDNDSVLEVFDKYYRYTTRTNNSGDYLMMGIPVGVHTLHMDLDLSDCGILSQKPRDFVYKGYTIEQFENSMMFKDGTEYSELSQVFTQDHVITVFPFWGNESQGETIGITREDLNIAFKFEPTCVFMGCVASDNSSNGITKKCKATENMGNMEELVTGEGTIEMIRKTPSGDIEAFQVKGTQLINSDGVWCYQIPMNLDYMMTDEYGNMVPTDDPNKGIPTRTSVRFRISMQDTEANLDNFFRSKVLVPHNPQFNDDGTHEGYDYEFGTYTKDESFRDLFWDNVYTVKSYIPRFQKRKVTGWKDKHFTGIKNCNFYGSNNPIPYNNLRIKLPLMFTIMCVLITAFILITSIFNFLTVLLGNMLAQLGRIGFNALGISWHPFKDFYLKALTLKLNTITEGLCPDLENWYFSPLPKKANLKTPAPPKSSMKRYNLLQQTLDYILKDEVPNDEQSIDFNNKDNEENIACLTRDVDYLISCVEMNLAMEYRVINFDFYNDWINGLIYIPRFMRFVRPKKTFLGITFAKAKVKGCMDDVSTFSKTRRYTQQCSMGYKSKSMGDATIFVDVKNPLSSNTKKKTIKQSNRFHKKSGFNQVTIMGKRGGICHEHTTSRKQNVYYMKPCEWSNNSKINLFATDIVLLGSLKNCDENGLPQAFRYLSSTSYIMPTNLAITNMETNGPLYTNKGTVCAGVKGTKLASEDYADNIQVLSPNEGIIAELQAYSNTKDENIDTKYEVNELSDLIPLTEAAGISWDYTGPGQGIINKSKMYYPGGHFLGLSCVNSESNIKSCINLIRICEVGSNISQRKEEISAITKNGITYINIAPTGFISGDDIVGNDFRMMFATMNQKRLQATKMVPETGYYYYDFNFIKPLNFDGAFSNMASSNNSYNNKIKIEDIPNEDLKNYNIAPLGGRPDEAIDRAETITRTIEDASIDYYRFRFGLDYNDLTKKSIKHKSKFLLSNGVYKFLPQYENSYYFYFGLKNGASAIDEFNKQFFSVCENTTIAHGNPLLHLSISEINFCEGKGTLECVVDNLEMPLRSIKIKYKQKDTKEEDITEGFKNQLSFTLEGKDFGEYTITVIDSNGISISKTIILGTDLFNCSLRAHNFNMKNIEYYKNKNIDLLYRGGYIEVENFICNQNYFNSISEYYFSIKNNDKDDEVNGSIIRKNGKFENYKIECTEANIDYDVYLHYTCDGSNFVKVYIDSIKVYDGSSVSLNMGWKNTPLYLEVSPKEDTYNMITESGITIKTGDFYFGGSWKENSAEDDNLKKWITDVCTIKTSISGIPFSNNVFAENGTKVLWGIPQNTKGELSSRKIHCTENDDESNYENHSLDDDASYVPTTKNYSAIAVNNDVVSGDFFGYYNGNNYVRIDGKAEPQENNGYVYKTLPSGELYYFVKKEGESFEGNVEDIESEDTCGIFYSSFEYPVIESSFTVNANFFIWGQPSIVKDELDESEPRIVYNEFAGRTEVSINGGLRYDGKLWSGSSISNIHPDKMILSANSINLKGGVVALEKDDGSIEYISAYTMNEKINKSYTTGVSGVSEVYYDISEGYPDISNIDTSSLVNNLSDYFNYANYFPTNVYYKQLTDTEPITPVINGGTSKGYFCINTIRNDKDIFIYAPSATTNDYYIYYKKGEKEPVYYILCRYIKNPEKHRSPEGELTILKIRFYTKSKFVLSFKYYKNNLNDDEGENEVIYEERYKNARDDRGDIYKLLENDKFYKDYVEPVPNYRIRTIDSWVDKIRDDKCESNAIKKIAFNQRLYYVSEYTSTISDGAGIMTLYKIFPNVWRVNRKEWGDDIELGFYNITLNSSGIIEQIKNESIIGSRNHITVSGNSYVVKATDDVEAKKQLKITIVEQPQIKIKFDDENMTEHEIERDFYTFVINPNTFSASTLSTEPGEKEYTVNFNFDLTIQSGDTLKDDEIIFYITEESEGAHLKVRRERKYSGIPWITISADTKEELSSLEDATSDNELEYLKNRLKTDFDIDNEQEVEIKCLILDENEKDIYFCYNEHYEENANDKESFIFYPKEIDFERKRDFTITSQNKRETDADGDVISKWLVSATTTEGRPLITVAQPFHEIAFGGSFSGNKIVIYKRYDGKYIQFGNNTIIIYDRFTDNYLEKYAKTSFKVMEGFTENENDNDSVSLIVSSALSDCISTDIDKNSNIIQLKPFSDKWTIENKKNTFSNPPEDYKKDHKLQGEITCRLPVQEGSSEPFEFENKLTVIIKPFFYFYICKDAAIEYLNCKVKGDKDENGLGISLKETWFDGKCYANNGDENTTINWTRDNGHKFCTDYSGIYLYGKNQDGDGNEILIDKELISVGYVSGNTLFSEEKIDKVYGTIQEYRGAHLIAENKRLSGDELFHISLDLFSIKNQDNNNLLSNYKIILGKDEHDFYEGLVSASAETITLTLYFNSKYLIDELGFFESYDETIKENIKNGNEGYMKGYKSEVFTRLKETNYSIKIKGDTSPGKETYELNILEYNFKDINNDNIEVKYVDNTNVFYYCVTIDFNINKLYIHTGTSYNGDDVNGFIKISLSVNENEPEPTSAPTPTPTPESTLESLPQLNLDEVSD